MSNWAIYPIYRINQPFTILNRLILPFPNSELYFWPRMKFGFYIICLLLLITGKASFAKKQLIADNISYNSHVVTKQGFNSYKTQFPQQILADQQNHDNDEMFVNEELDDEDLNETILRKCRPLAFFEISVDSAYVQRNDLLLFKDPADFNCFLSDIYIVQRTLRI